MQRFSRLNNTLTLGLLCLPLLLQAQGTEKALEAFFYILIGLGIWVALGLVILICAAIYYRSKKLTVAGCIFAGINFLVAVYLSLKNSGDHYYQQGLIYDAINVFFTGALVYLILLIVVQRKWKVVTDADTLNETPENFHKSKRHGWIRFWILLYLLIYLYGEMINWVNFSRSVFELPIRLYLILFFQLLILAGALYGLWKKTTWGWILIVFSAIWYILSGFYQLFNVLFVYPDLNTLPSSFFIRQGIALLICVSVLFLCQKPDIAESFKLESGKRKKLFWSVLFTALVVCLVNILLNLL